MKESVSFKQNYLKEEDGERLQVKMYSSIVKCTRTTHYLPCILFLRTIYSTGIWYIIGRDGLAQSVKCSIPTEVRGPMVTYGTGGHTSLDTLLSHRKDHT